MRTQQRYGQSGLTAPRGVHFQHPQASYDEADRLDVLVGQLDRLEVVAVDLA